jgi:Na+/H+-dicarboxylate symporter
MVLETLTSFMQLQRDMPFRRTQANICFTTSRYFKPNGNKVIQGGAVFIMLPIYQNYLGFMAEMTSLILAFNMLLDPFVTSTNVMANISLCSVFEKVWERFLAFSGKKTFNQTS